ncbi:hypothetical protein L596_029146 [Steinernema carpocapsae]|uniref:Major facilitator superfamily (MFS) profile domain-containing protein n=1 Tax=Steinernema carpocapsae TaxID=34508 RepID=A0A4V5ZXD7_STECR|nr:hypothetical protein L596_029146 [Steinernema carpocapsae]
MTTKFIRYVILVFTLITMTMLLANSVLFNFTVICMKAENRIQAATVANETQTRFYSSSEEGLLIAAPSVGLIVGTFPSIYLKDKLGLRLSFTAFGWISGLATGIYPLVASNLLISLVVRFAQGFGMAAAFVAIGVVPMDYGGDKLKGLFLAVLTCSYQIGPFITIPSSAMFCSSSIGWHGVYYMFGFVTILAFTIFVILYRNSAHKAGFHCIPRVMPTIKNIDDGLPERFDLPTVQKPKKKKKAPAPYRAALTSMSVWGILFASIGDSLGFLVFYLYGPIYVNKVLQFEVGKTGVMAALPYVGGIGSKFLGGMLFHVSSCLKSSKGIMVSTLLYKSIMTINFFLLTILAPSYPTAAETTIIITSIANGFHFMSLMNAAQAVAKQHTYIISSAIAALESVVGLTLPPVVSYFAPHHSPDEWKVILYFVVGILALSNVLFAAMTRVRPSKWTREHFTNEPEDVKETVHI